MSSILDPLVARIRAIPSAYWEDIADAAGCAKSLPRKLAARDRVNPQVLTIQPLIDFFEAVDGGRRTLPAGALEAIAQEVEAKARASGLSVAAHRGSN